MSIKVKLKGGETKEYFFDEVVSITEQGNFFIVQHIAGLTLFDKRDVEEVTKSA